MVYYKEFANSPERSFMLLKDQAILPLSTSTLPLIEPNGLSEERKLYLYCEIRQFCKSGTEDIVAPLPKTPHSQNYCYTVPWIEKC